MDELDERLARLKPLQGKTRAEFDQDPYLRDIVERNLEIAAQCCIDICHRIITLENARKPVDYYESFVILGEMNVIDMDFARGLAPIAGFRNILIHEYLVINWDYVYKNLQNINEMSRFGLSIRKWIKNRE